MTPFLEVPARTLYDRVHSQLKDLIPSFGLAANRAQICRTLETLCRESLDMPMGRRPPAFSTINEDGTPFQYALTMAASWQSPLQFLSEAGIPGSSMSDRAALSKDRVRILCSLLGAEGSVEQLGNLMDRFAPQVRFELHANDAGVFWIGTRFEPNTPAKLIVYINGKWGSAEVRWQRSSEFAVCLGALGAWKPVEPLFANGMEPLGLALTVSQDSPITGRIYASSYGKPLSFFKRIVQSLQPFESATVLKEFAEIILGSERQYPIRSAVCSVGLDQRQLDPDFKLELCGHCIFSSDVDAVTRCTRWLRAMDSDPSRYHELLRVIAPGPLSSTGTNFHSYLGFGWKAGELYTSMYLKPNTLSAPRNGS